jgi:hypothetical protein
MGLDLFLEHRSAELDLFERRGMELDLFAAPGYGGQLFDREMRSVKDDGHACPP